MQARRTRVLTPDADEHRFTETCFALSSGTRLAVLTVLLHAGEPLHIREVARRVDADPSPVRAHLDLLVKTGLARELPELGRERRFVPEVSALRLTLAPPDVASKPPADKKEAKLLRRITERMKEIEAKIHKLEQEHARLGEERAALSRKD